MTELSYPLPQRMWARTIHFDHRTCVHVRTHARAREFVHVVMGELLITRVVCHGDVRVVALQGE